MLVKQQLVKQQFYLRLITNTYNQNNMFKISISDFIDGRNLKTLDPFTCHTLIFILEIKYTELLLWLDLS